MSSREKLGVAAFGQKAHLRRHDGAFAVHVDGAAFQHELVGTVAVDSGQVGHLHADKRVLVPREVQAVHQPAPAVEVPVHGAHAAFVVDDEGRAAVADPRVVGRHLDDAHVVQIAQLVARRRVVFGVHAHRDGLELRDGLRDLLVGMLGRLRAVAPVVGAAGPQHPDAVLRLEFGRHAVSVALGGGFVFEYGLHGRFLSSLVCSGVALPGLALGPSAHRRER